MPTFANGVYAAGYCCFYCYALDKYGEHKAKRLCGVLG